MIKTLAQELLAERLLSKDDSVVAGVSGGADSMALIHLLVGLNQTLDWRLHLHVAHLNHGIRGQDAEQDAAFVQAAADHLSVPCTIETRDVAALAKQYGLGLEEAGRQERYAFLGRVCLQTGAKVVAVGHHADDNAETILHRILRGTGLRGLAGIPRSRQLGEDTEVRVIRPLLRFSRQALVDYLADVGIAYREDPSNLSNEPMRNRLRSTIFPLLRAEVNPQVHDALNRLGEQAQWLQEFLRETVHRTFETLIISRTDQVLTLNADALVRKSRIVQTELVRLAYRSFGLGEQDLAFTHLVSVLDLVADPASGKQTVMPGGMIIEKRYGQLSFSLPSEEPRETIAPEVMVQLPGHTLLPIRRLEIECAVETARPDQIPGLRRAGAKMEERVDFDLVHPPLVVRGRRRGDRFFPLGAPGSKKLSEFLIAAKVNPVDRERVAILCDHLGPIWVIGHRIDDRVKLTALTRRILHLRARPLDP